MATKVQIDRLAQRIEDLAQQAVPRSGPRIGVIWRMPGETGDAARSRHARQYPGDAVESMLIIGRSRCP